MNWINDVNQVGKLVDNNNNDRPSHADLFLHITQHQRGTPWFPTVRLGVRARAVRKIYLALFLPVLTSQRIWRIDRPKTKLLSFSTSVIITSDFASPFFKNLILFPRKQFCFSPVFFWVCCLKVLNETFANVCLSVFVVC